VADSAGAAVWRWDQVEPFGVNVPDENPSSLGAFEYPLRFPGQYADKETGLHYNYFRDYDSGVGRYVQSDPIGIAANWPTPPTMEVNHLYSYVNGRPLELVDPNGLAPWAGYNYCGPGNRKPLPPVNCYDAACKEHDECYLSCGVNAAQRWLPRNLFTSCPARCDWKLNQDHKVCKDQEFCQIPRLPLSPLPTAP